LAAIAFDAFGPNVQLYADGSPAALALTVGAALAVVALIMVLVARSARSNSAGQVALVTEEAVRTDRRTFLLRLDHELKNPITAMRAAVANATAALDPTEVEARESLGSLDAQAVRLSRLTADLRKIAEVETQTVSLAPVELSQLLEEVKSAVEHTSGRSIRLILHEAPTPVGAVAGDEDLLFLAVHNLVANAAKFCADGDAIELRAFNDPPWVLIEVADTGPGIPADEVALVWEELGRGRNARGVPGSGLGLPLVRTIIGRHGGLIELHSDEGKGTLFAVRLHPAASTRTQQLDLTIG
jgi:two-component system OmpR family sensor kinase